MTQPLGVNSAPMTIQQVSLKTGLTIPTLRYYEEIGLIDPVPRDQRSRHRRYPSNIVDRIESLAHLRAAGLSIEGMRQLMSTGGHSPETIATKVELLTSHRDGVDAQIAALIARRDYLNNRIAFWAARVDNDLEAARELENDAAVLVKQLPPSRSLRHMGGIG